MWYVCVCRVRGLHLRRGAEQATPGKNNTEVKAWNEHVRRGLECGRRAEPGRAVGKLKGPRGRVRPALPEEQQEADAGAEGQGEVTSCWCSALEITEGFGDVAVRRKPRRGRGVNEQCDWLTMLNSYLNDGRGGKGWGGRKISQETMQSLSRRWWWLR